MVSPDQSIYAYNVLMERLESQCIEGPKLAPFAGIENKDASNVHGAKK
jgi:hypothetical protein